MRARTTTAACNLLPARWTGATIFGSQFLRSCCLPSTSNSKIQSVSVALPSSATFCLCAECFAAERDILPVRRLLRGRTKVSNRRSFQCSFSLRTLCLLFRSADVILQALTVSVIFTVFSLQRFPFCYGSSNLANFLQAPLGCASLSVFFMKLSLSRCLDCSLSSSVVFHHIHDSFLSAFSLSIPETKSSSLSGM